MVGERTARFSLEQEHLCVYRQTSLSMDSFSDFTILYVCNSRGHARATPHGEARGQLRGVCSLQLSVGSGDRSGSLGFCGKCHSSLSNLTGLQNSGFHQTGSWIPSAQWKVLVSLWQNYRRPVSHNSAQRGRGIRTQHSPHSLTRCYELFALGWQCFHVSLWVSDSSLSKYHDPWPLVAVGPWKDILAEPLFLHLHVILTDKATAKTKLLKRS